MAFSESKLDFDDFVELAKMWKINDDTCSNLVQFLNQHQHNLQLSTEQKQALWSCVCKFESHNPTYKPLAEARKNFLPFTKKQRNKPSASTKDTRFESDTCYVAYNGPNDPDRYLGHGEFDDDDGYYC